jgi:ribosomal protein RSM22 (predicted rRNA methylase)
MGLKQIHDELERSIEQFIQSTPKFQDKRRLARELEERFSVIHSLFTTARSEKNYNYYKDEFFRLAYMKRLLPVNACKIAEIMDELAGLGYLKGLSERQELNVLDVGAGPGTALTGFYLWFHDWKESGKGIQPLNLVAVDRDRKVLSDGKELFKILDSRRNKEPFAKYQYMDCNLSKRGELERKLERRRFDLVFAANFFNELGEQRSRQELRLGILRMLFHGVLGRDGLLVIVEPGTRIASKNLIGLRDAFLESRRKRDDAVILSPCTHQKFCPLGVASDRDWCFRVLADIFADGPAAYSYLVISKSTSSGADRRAPKDRSARIISDIFDDGGRKVFLTCGSSGKKKQRVSDYRDKVGEIRRGGLCEVEVSTRHE